MKKIIAIGFFLCTIGLPDISAQDTGWETGINISGGGAWTKPTFGAANADFSWHYGAGLYGRKLFKPGVGIELGVQFGQYSTFTEIEAYFNDMIDPQIGYNGDPAIVQYNRHIRYVEIPVKFVYLKNINKFGIGFNLGVAPSIPVQGIDNRKITGETAEAGTMRINRTQDLRGFNIFGETALILRANIKPHFSLDFKPFFRGSLMAAYKSGGNYHPHTLGLSVSTVYKF